MLARVAKLQDNHGYGTVVVSKECVRVYSFHCTELRVSTTHDWPGCTDVLHG